MRTVEESNERLKLTGTNRAALPGGILRNVFDQYEAKMPQVIDMGGD